MNEKKLRVEGTPEEPALVESKSHPKTRPATAAPVSQLSTLNSQLLPLLLAFGVCGAAPACLGLPPSPGFPGSSPGGGLHLAQALPDAGSSQSIGWIIVAVAVCVTAIGGVLAFMRHESRMEEPKSEHRISGGPVTIRHKEVFVERHEHNGLKEDLENHKRDIWEVVKGLRSAVGRIETSTAETKVLREANGELLTEVREEVTSLGKAVARLAAIVETKLEAKHK